jgi:hypothetical protein
MTSASLIYTIRQFLTERGLREELILYASKADESTLRAWLFQDEMDDG